MRNKIFNITYTIFVVVLLCSCSIIKYPHGIYKNIEKNYNYKTDSSDSCSIQEYRYKFPFFKKFNGRICFSEFSNSRTCAEFANGFLNGTYYYYEQDKSTKNYVLTQERNYDNGVLDGMFYDFYKVYSHRNQNEVKVTRKGKYENGYVNGFVEIYENGRLVRKAEYKNSVKEGYEYFYTEDNNVDTIHYTYHPNYKSFRTIAYIKEKSFCPVLKTYNSDQFQYIEGKFSINGALNPSSGIDDYTPLFILDYQCYIKQLKEPRSHYYIVDYGGFYGSLYIVSPPFGPIKLGLIDMDDL